MIKVGITQQDRDTIERCTRGRRSDDRTRDFDAFPALVRCGKKINCLIVRAGRWTLDPEHMPAKAIQPAQPAQRTGLLSCFGNRWRHAEDACENCNRLFIAGVSCGHYLKRLPGQRTNECLFDERKRCDLEKQSRQCACGKFAITDGVRCSLIDCGQICDSSLIQIGVEFFQKCGEILSRRSGVPQPFRFNAVYPQLDKC